MQLLDANVLIYSHREDHPEHELYSGWLRDLMESSEPIALSELMLSAFLRIVTNRRIFDPATPMEVALEVCARLKSWPTAVIVRPTSRHWSIFVKQIEDGRIHGPMVTDAYLAALAIEHGCELISTDGDFARFPELRWRHPLETP